MEAKDKKVILRLEEIDFSYQDDEPLLETFSLKVYQGETLAIVGHNGSGKSTIAKLLSGILSIKGGKFYIDEIDVSDNSQNENIETRVGIVFQNPDNQFIGTTVEDDIAFGLENAQVKREDMDPIIDDVLLKVKMEGFRKREPEQLSGGQKQRIAIAGALALSPDVLILDEATAMLDPVGKKDIDDVLQELRISKPNATIILITHDLEETVHADRVIVLNHGSIVLKGTPFEVYRNERALKDINLDVPFFFRVRNRLLKDGYKIENIGTLEELVRYINENRIS